MWYAFFLERLMNKKYPAVKMPDTLRNKLFFKALASVAF